MADDDDAGWDLHALLNCAPARLSYSVHSTSGVYASFTPDNILTDNPNSDTSRWTAPPPDHRRKPPAGSGPQRRRRDPEWIILKLDHIALVRRIGFGKTSKPHPCNLADFTLWGGLTPSPLAMEPLLDTTLKNDAVPERFDLSLALGAAPLPVRYLKIDCHGAANAAYSISIWHIWLEGFLPSSGALAPSAPALEAQYAAHLARQSTHLTLAYLRRAGPSTLPAFAALGATPAAQGLEHPLLSSLHDALVAQGDFPRAEALLDRLLAEGLLFEHAPGGGKGASSARWARLAPSSPGPRGRGGHALVRAGRKLLLFGGWDGSRDLGDLWEWDLASTAGDGGWRCLDDGAGEGHGEGRPQARSCHQMAVDEREGWVYLFGGRRDELDSDEDDDEDHEGEDGAPSAQAGGMDLDGPPLSSVDRALDRALARLQRRAGRWKSDFWRYKAVGPGRGTWECLSEDTRKDGGPALLFDHAMAVHSSTSRLFVFGGKNQPYDPDPSPSSSTGVTDDPALDAGAGAHEGRYSGMWCYDISQRRWSHLFGDPRPSSFTRAPSPASSDRLLSRAGHALALDEHAPGGPTLYVRGGQRNEQYLADEWAVRLAAAPAAGGEDEAEGQLWRQGAVLDLPPPPPPAGTRSLVDPAALPVSGTGSRAREPTIVQIRRLASPSSSSGATGDAPPAGFTQRLSLVPSLDGGDSPASWTLLTGLTGHSALASLSAGVERDRERERAAERGEGEERCVRGVWRRGGGAGGTWERVREEEGERPCGRYAAQVVYDPLRAEHYLFGGCPEVPPPEGDGGEARLGDLWKLKIIDPTPEEALRRMKFLVRKQRFTELCATAPTVLALQYLQNDLSAVVDHSSPSESSSFRSCMTALLSAPGQMNIDADSALASSRPPSPTAGEAAGTYAARHALWEELGRFVPRGERQPDERLEDAGRVLRVWEMGGWGALGA